MADWGWSAGAGDGRLVAPRQYGGPLRLPVFAVGLLLVLAGCSDDPAATSGNEGAAPTGGVPAWASPPVRPKCAEVFVPGKTIVFPPAEAAKGCADPDGGINVVGSFRCGDGRHLFQVDASSGAPRGWGFDGPGDVYHASAGEVASDPGYSAAYDKCNT